MLNPAIFFFLFFFTGIFEFRSSNAQALSESRNQPWDGQNNQIKTAPDEARGFKEDSAIQHKSLFYTLNNHGVRFGISETLEGYHNFMGGIRIGSTYASTFDVNINADLKKLIGLSDGGLYADLEDHAGNNPTKTLIGDFQVFDKHNAAPFLQMLEVWYQQKLFNDFLRIKIGKIDANSEFSVIDNGLEFINSSTQVTPTFFVFPTFPDPVPSINIFFTPGKVFYSNFAIDDANRSDHYLDFYGYPTSVQPTLHGELFMNESGLIWDYLSNWKRDGNLRIGVWEHTGTFTQIDGALHQGAEGFYMIFNQTLWQPISKTDDVRGLRLFLEYAFTQDYLTAAYQHFGGGMVWTGWTKNEPGDGLGISAHYTNLSPDLKVHKTYELNLETFFKLIVTNEFSIKPDAQFIVNPGGQYNNALVVTLMLTYALSSAGSL